MLNVGVTVVLVEVGVAVGFALAWFSVHRGRRHDRDSGLAIELLRQREVIADYEATIHAYRQFVHDDPELSLTSR
jgi:hypothetical protein